MIEKLATNIGQGIVSVVKTYIAAVIVLMVKGEFFNIAIRIWTGGEATFWGNGLWQINFILAIFFTLFYYVNPNP